MTAAVRDQMLERPLPHSAESERAILGAIIINNSLAVDAAELLSPDDFYVRAHYHVFKVMIAMSERGAEINPILLGEELRREGVLEQVGGFSFVSELSHGLPHFSNLSAYAKVVRDKSLMRQLVKAANKVISEALEEEDEAQVVLDHAEQTVAALRESHPASGAARLFTARPINEWLDLAASRPVPRRIFGDFWAEGELAILFADTGAGKSVLAVQVGDSSATGEPIAGFEMEAAPQTVLYFDFELTDLQLQKRYAVERRAGGEVWYDRHRRFSERLRRVEINGASRVFDTVVNWEQVLLAEMEREIEACGARLVIVDNIGYLARETDKGKFALPLMQRLNDLKKQRGLSIMVLAHTPKRDETRPISINDLAGSKIIANYADSVFAIGKSSRDPNLRYLKQLKARSTDISHGTDSVAVCRFEKVENFLSFEFVYVAPEYDHLKTPTEGDKSELVAQVKSLSGRGMSQRAVARELGISVGAVNKYLNADKTAAVHGVHGVHAMNTVNTVNAQPAPPAPVDGGKLLHMFGLQSGDWASASAFIAEGQRLYEQKCREGLDHAQALAAARREMGMPGEWSVAGSGSAGNGNSFHAGGPAGEVEV